MQYTLQDLDASVRAAAGDQDDVAPLTEDTLDVEFADMGCDSLVLLELINSIRRSHGLELPDDAVEHMRTPRAALTHINERFAQTTVGG